MAQNLLHLVQALLEAVAEQIGAENAALALPNAQAEASHILARAGPRREGEWPRLLHGSAEVLCAPLVHPSHPAETAWLCFADGSHPWTASDRQLCAAAAAAIAHLFAGYDGQVDWMQITASQRILAVTEEELCRIVLDIHDGPVQKLFAASSLLDHVQASTPLAPDVQREVQRVAGLLEAAMREIRIFLGAFRPPDFAARPLLEVLEDLIIQQEQLTGANICLEAQGELPAVSIPTKIALYRIVQEALSNAARHAGVDEHFVHLWSRPSGLVLEIIDYGRGFDPPPLDGPFATEASQHIGLRGMRDRVHLVGGTLRVESAPGRGTTIHVEAPIDG